MRQESRNVLIVDDNPSKLADMRLAAQVADPWATIYEAEHVRGALAIIGMLGGDIEAGGIDYDLPDGKGSEVIAAVRRRNPHTGLALYTAREGGCFEEAKHDALNAGAHDAFSAAVNAPEVLLPILSTRAGVQELWSMAA